MNQVCHSALPTSLLWLLALLITVHSALAQDDIATPQSKFIDAGDVRLQYLDFGGEGLPIVFIHGVERGAETWAGFAPRFTNHHHALALTARGVGESEGEQGDTKTRAGDIISLLDALDIERAIFIGNSGPGMDMTFLAEHHSDRVAGLVYLANAPPDTELENLDPSGGLRMAARATRQSMGADPYQPRFVVEPGYRMGIPALTFVSTTGYRGWGNMPFPLEVIDRVAEAGSDWIEDPEAKAFFDRAVADEAFRDEVRRGWEEAVVPAVRAREDAFRAAFGENLHIVKLDVPFVTGYQYLDDPKMIEPHVRAFLEEARERERSSERLDIPIGLHSGEGSPGFTRTLPIIDMHLHAFDPEEIEGENTFCANDGPVEFPPIDPAEEARMDDAMACPSPLRKAATEADNQDRHRAIMERYNIYGVLDVTRSSLAESLANADDWQASAPGRYWIAIDPYDAYSPPVEELEALAAEGRFQLLAELSPQYDGMLATDPKFAPYFALAERLDIPVGLHLGEGPPGVTRTLPGTRYSPALGRPLDLVPLLQQYPRLRLYVMHYGSPLIEEMLAMLHAYPGLYVDLAGNNWKMPRPYFHAQLRRFVDAGFSQRLMFGSDSMIWPDALPIAIDAINSAPFLSEQQKRDILYNNAARFLRLDQATINKHHRR